MRDLELPTGWREDEVPYERRGATEYVYTRRLRVRYCRKVAHSAADKWTACGWHEAAHHRVDCG